MAASRGEHLRVRTGDIVRQRYQIVEEIGCGNFSKVYKCYDLHKSSAERKQYPVALKVLKKEYRNDASFEKRMLRALSDRDPDGAARVSKMIDYFEWLEYPTFVMPIHGAAVRARRLGINRGCVSRNRFLEFAFDILETLAFVHFTCKMVHTDLKPENILIADSHTPDSSFGHSWVICDFGSASFWRLDKLDSDLISTRPYRAPEVVLGNKWHHAADMWSVGCILYEVAVGSRLFEVRDDPTHLYLMERRLGRIPELFSARSKNSTKFFTSKGQIIINPETLRSGKFNVSPLREMFRGDPQLLSLLLSLLTYDPQRRATALVALEHPIFDGTRAARSARSTERNDESASAPSDAVASPSTSEVPPTPSEEQNGAVARKTHPAPPLPRWESPDKPQLSAPSPAPPGAVAAPYTRSPSAELPLAVSTFPSSSQTSSQGKQHPNAVPDKRRSVIKEAPSSRSENEKGKSQNASAPLTVVSGGTTEAAVCVPKLMLSSIDDTRKAGSKALTPKGRGSSLVNTGRSRRSNTPRSGTGTPRKAPAAAPRSSSTPPYRFTPAASGGAGGRTASPTHSWRKAATANTTTVCARSPRSSGGAVERKAAPLNKPGYSFSTAARETGVTRSKDRANALAPPASTAESNRVVVRPQRASTPNITFIHRSTTKTPPAAAPKRSASTTRVATPRKHATSTVAPTTALSTVTPIPVNTTDGGAGNDSNPTTIITVPPVIATTGTAEPAPPSVTFSGGMPDKLVQMHLRPAQHTTRIDPSIPFSTLSPTLRKDETSSSLSKDPQRESSDVVIGTPLYTFTEGAASPRPTDYVSPIRQRDEMLTSHTSSVFSSPTAVQFAVSDSHEWQERTPMSQMSPLSERQPLLTGTSERSPYGLMNRGATPPFDCADLAPTAAAKPPSPMRRSPRASPPAAAPLLVRSYAPIIVTHAAPAVDPESKTHPATKEGSTVTAPAISKKRETFTPREGPAVVRISRSSTPAENALAGPTTPANASTLAGDSKASAHPSVVVSVPTLTRPGAPAGQLSKPDDADATRGPGSHHAKASSAVEGNGDGSDRRWRSLNSNGRHTAVRRHGDMGSDGVITSGRGSTQMRDSVNSLSMSSSGGIVIQPPTSTRSATSGVTTHTPVVAVVRPRQMKSTRGETLVISATVDNLQSVESGARTPNAGRGEDSHEESTNSPSVHMQVRSQHVPPLTLGGTTGLLSSFGGAKRSKPMVERSNVMNMIANSSGATRHKRWPSENSPNASAAKGFTDVSADPEKVAGTPTANDLNEAPSTFTRRENKPMKKAGIRISSASNLNSGRDGANHSGGGMDTGCVTPLSPVSPTPPAQRVAYVKQ